MDIVIHIGMPRTGSTFLQNEIFRNLDNVNFIGFFSRESFETLFHKRDDVLKNLFLNIDKIDINKYQEFFDSKILRSEINLISEENIYCDMWSKEDNRIERINNLKNIYPNARIILGIRKKKSMINSWYKKYISCGGIYTFEKFKREVINLKKLNPIEYINYLESLYGRKNIYIYEFENLQQNIDQFIDDICKFIGVNSPNYKNKKRNRGYTHHQLKIARIMNHLYKTPLNPYGFIPLDYRFHPHKILFQNLL